jgi:MFS family permease
MVAILYLGYMLAFIDRQIIAYLVAPIRADLQITDFQFSLIHGLAFVIFYASLGIPIGWLADRSNRKNIVAVGVALWSLMTAMCGLANNFWQLFLARIGVGVGEAALSPCAISLISDSYPHEQRGLPINVYAAGVHGGIGFANIFSGVIVGFTAALGTMEIMLLDSLKPWQLTFIIVGLPGLLLALIAFTLREPTRKDRRSSGTPISLAETAAYLVQHRRVYLTVIIGAAVSALGSYAMYSWVPALFARHFDWSATRLGLHFGIITLVCGSAGLAISGAIAGTMVRTGNYAAPSKLMIISMAMTVPPAAGLMLVDNPYWTLSCLALLIFFMGTPIGLAQVALQAVTPNEMRAQVIAIYLTAVAVIGLGTGPSAVAAFTDFYFMNDAAVGSSLSIVMTLSGIVSVVILLLGVPAYVRMEQQQSSPKSGSIVKK